MLAVPSGINVINTVIADMFSLNADDTFVRLFLLFNEHKTICKFSKNLSVKSKKSKQRIVKGYKISVFAAYHLEGYLFYENRLYFRKKVPN